ncbi:metal ABC transporter permease [Thermicanus aegyptius]|uniref:metal ABC transporter permease n=1 Tax=Thermicanus aegyptius TaxID=94009 RepID=UPI00040BC11F|nr:metal ABC transporter permease [Thermicanus aegyptius]
MLQDFFTYSFLQYGLLAGLMVGWVAPLIGVFIVVRRLSLIADALSHITLAGVAAGLLLGQLLPALGEISPLYFGLLFAVIGALLIERLRKAYRSYQELAIPIILSAGIGLAVVLISLAHGFNVDLFGLLFGNILAVTEGDLLRIFIVSLVVIIAVWLFYKELLLLSFDEEGAKLAGVPGGWINLFFSLLVGLVISISMQVVGILLVSALITLPVAAAMRITSSFKQTLFVSILFGEISVLLGMMLSYWFNLASGGTIVLVAVVILLVLLGRRGFRPV